MAHAHSDNGARSSGGGGAGVWGVMAEFATPAALSHAAEKVRDEGYSRWDVYSPFPVHGMDEAMGLRPSRVPWIMGAMALAGFTTAITMQWWMSAVDYPIPNGGKPLFAWEQFLPIMFELSVLFAAFGAVVGMLALNGLPRWHHPLFGKERFLRVSDDRFVIVIEAKDPKFDASRTRGFLERLGGQHIEMVEDEA
ncbi:MAG TPA: DUF3341 domain-containing protein [Phycisphaerales bacterium]|nr:DUF3341 domain-containing protein [Phycisphaerales bacterium]